MNVSLIHSLVDSGRITPRDGALLLEFGRMLAWQRKPWWERALVGLWRAVFEW